MSYKDRDRQREYQRNYNARNRAEWMAGKACVDCGCIERLEVDHVDRTGKISHKVWSWSKERREAELAKCVVRCRACHQKKTNTDLRQGHIVHGEYHRGYGNGCRCSKCRAANAQMSQLKKLRMKGMNVRLAVDRVA